MIRKFGSSILLLCALAFCAGTGLVSRPIPPSLHGNALLDLDGDGTLDAIQLKFLGNLDSSILAEDLDSIVFPWVDSAGQSTLLTILGSQFTILAPDSRVAYYRFPNQSRFFSFLTSFDSSRFTFDRNPQIHSHLPDGNAIVMPLRLQDGMFPIVRKAELSIGKDYNSPDKLTLEFSEHIAGYPGVDLRKMLEIYRHSNNSQEVLTADKVTITDSRHIVLEFSHSKHGVNRPNSQDSIRVLPGFLDHPTLGPCSPPLCSERPWKAVLASLDISLSTSSFGVIREDVFPKKNMELIARKFGSGSTSETGAGVYLDFGSADLLHSVRLVLKDRLYSQDSSVIAENIPIDNEKIFMDLGVSLFSKFGEFVASAQYRISCSDSLFLGDCGQNPRQVFLRWNGLSQTGRKVASGAYISQVSLRIRYGKPPSGIIEIAQEDLREFWGIMRAKGTE